MALNEGIFARVGEANIPTPGESAVHEVLTLLNEAEKVLEMLSEQLTQHDSRLFGPKAEKASLSCAAIPVEQGQLGALVNAARRVRDAAYRADCAAGYINRI